MSTPPADDETPWRRRFASRANNRGWALAEQATRTPAEDDEMLHAAHAAAHLWQPIATGRQRAHADLLLGQVHALLGHADAATRHANAAFDVVGAGDPWEVALGHVVLANAAACRGDAGTHRDEHATARRLIDALADPEEKDILLASLRVVPEPVPVT